jgi:DHA1 family bicyclomycin/chloramphenicol resistance-like MFS transporter
MNEAGKAISDEGGGVTLPPQARIPLWLVALLTFSGTLAMHIFVPALPIAAADLGVGASAMQMTISL